MKFFLHQGPFTSLAATGYTTAISTDILVGYPAPGRDAAYCDVCLCLSVCLSADTFLRQTSVRAPDPCGSGIDVTVIPGTLYTSGFMSSCLRRGNENAPEIIVDNTKNIILNCKQHFANFKP